MAAAALPLRAPWRDLFGAAFTLALVAAALFAALRAAALLGPHALAPLLPLGFVLMSAMPFVFLTAAGRPEIGLRAPAGWRWVVVALPIGALLALACGALGLWWFGTGADHWYSSIANYYGRQLHTHGLDLLALHLTFTLPALIGFSC